MAAPLPGSPGALTIVFGDVMLDRNVLGHVERISPEAPAPVVRVEGDTAGLGGAANVANNVRCLGHSCTLVGVRGDDEDGTVLERLAGARGIESRLVVAADRPTTTKTRIYADRGQQVLRLDREVTAPVGAAEERRLQRVLGEALPLARAAIVSDYAKGAVTDTLLGWFLTEAKRRGLPTVVDPKRRDITAYRGASVITPNVREAAMALGVDTIPPGDDAASEAAERLRLQGGVGSVLLTRGEHGMVLRTADNSVYLRSRARAVSDVTGAGDTVVAMLAVSLAEGMSLPEAAELANLAAGLAVEKVGTQPVRRDEVEQALAGRYTSHKIMTREAARTLAAHWRHQGKIVVFTNGCFDLLHAGHIYCLEEARRQGSCLIVALNSDQSVRILKGAGRPLVPERQRAVVLAALACVDAVVLFDEEHPAALVDECRPHVLAKGGDYKPEQIAGSARVLADGGRVAIIPLVPELSTTRLVERLKDEG